MADQIAWLSTARVGQLTGCSSTRDPDWPFAEDPVRLPLLTDTGRWDVHGVDMGANTEHSDGRLYIFFGDVAVEQDPNKVYSHGAPAFSGNPINSDLVGWTDARELIRFGGHRALGWKFFLPNDRQGAGESTGQGKWRFCNRCHGLFWAPQGQPAGVCRRGGAHNPIGWEFFLPNDHQGGTAQTGQKDWRFCGTCHGLCWAPGGQTAGACPAGGQHAPIGWMFFLPNDHQGGTEQTGQKAWRFCAGCHGLFWDGEAHKGVCPGAPGGGGFQLQAVLRQDGKFAPFRMEEPYGLTESLEVPSGAFSHGGRVYVFTNISPWKYSGKKRPVDPTYGLYLVSSHHPGHPVRYETEFLVNPRVGWCPTDDSRQVFESHMVRGLRFVLPHSRPGAPSHEAGWRYCGRCHTLFREGAAANVCWKGGPHDGGASLQYVLPFGRPEDIQNQSNWHQCLKCASLFWNGDQSNAGLCPAGGRHAATGGPLVIPNASPLDHADFHEDAHHQPNWRFCAKCGGLFFWDDDPAHRGHCPKGNGHEAWGLTFVLRHDAPGPPIPEDALNQKNWRCCAKCLGLFWAGDGAGFRGRCPADGLTHDALGRSFNFVLHHDDGADATRQSDWRFCTRCAGLAWHGDTQFNGVCPAGPGGHNPMGFNFVLPHNPGQDPQNQAGWRFCEKCHGMVSTHQFDVFPGIAPVVVQNAAHTVGPGLPESTGEGVVMFAKGYWRGPREEPGLRVAWMPLRGTNRPRLQDVRYYTGRTGADAWTDDVNETANLFELPPHWSSVSALWLSGPRRWIVVYCDAEDKRDDLSRFERPVYARISATLNGFGAAQQVEIFNPWREGAYGTWANKPGFGSFPVNYPPLPPFVGGDPANDRENLPGWAYGAFLLERFTTWDENTRELNLHYLLSLGRPYQVQLVHTRLRIL